MAAFDRDEFWIKIADMYDTAKENDYMVKLDEEQVDELKTLFINLYIPEEKLRYYTDEKLIKKMMTTIVSIYKLDKDSTGNNSDVVQLVNTVKYDGRNMYLQYAKISPVKFRRLNLDKTVMEVAESMGYGVSAVKNCESIVCDLSKQPEKLVEKLAKALECEPEALY